MRRRTRGVLGLLIGGIVAAVVLLASPLRSFGWTTVPSVTIVSAPGDPRIPVVQEAIDFWNQTFADLGTPFRLGAPTLVTGSVPDADLAALSGQVLRGWWWPTLPQSVERFSGDLVIVLSDADFISFAARGRGRTVVGIKNRNAPLLKLPNVLRNVVAHELGHAVGLRHNADPTLLMCGRPAPCRPDTFQSGTPRFFPLSDADRARLGGFYPRDWASAPR